MFISSHIKYFQACGSPPSLCTPHFSDPRMPLLWGPWDSLKFHGNRTNCENSANRPLHKALPFDVKRALGVNVWCSFDRLPLTWTDDLKIQPICSSYVHPKFRRCNNAFLSNEHRTFTLYCWHTKRVFFDYTVKKDLYKAVTSAEESEMVRRFRHDTPKTSQVRLQQLGYSPEMT